MSVPLPAPRVDADNLVLRETAPGVAVDDAIVVTGAPLTGGSDLDAAGA